MDATHCQRDEDLHPTAYPYHQGQRPQQQGTTPGYIVETMNESTMNRGLSAMLLMRQCNQFPPS